MRRTVTKKICQWLGVLAPILLVLVFVAVTSESLQSDEIKIPPLSRVPPNLELRVDAREHARAFCNGMQTIVCVADHFEFFERNLIGGRKLIAQGPWGGLLKENYPGKYSLTGSDLQSGAAYTIIFQQINPDTIELTLTFTSPSRSSDLGFDIIKLSSDLFVDASLESSPLTFTDAKTVPGQPLPFSKRMLLTDKNRVLLRGAFCDLEIRDLNDSQTIYAADGRNLPWDKRKSIILGVSRDKLLPGKEYSFKYSIRSMAPSGSIRIRAANVPGTNKIDRNVWSFYSIPPKKDIKETGKYCLRAEDTIFGVPGGTAENILAREIQTSTSMRLNVAKAESLSTSRGIFIERIPKGQFPAEGFEIVTSPQKVIIRGGDERGCLFGVYALMARLRHEDNGWKLACGRVSDWPDLAVRGACMELLRPAIRDVELMKRYLDALSRARANTVILLHLPGQIRSWRDGRDDGGWTMKQMREIANYARWLHMDVWGGMGSGYSAKDFPEMEIRSDSNFYNPFNDKNYRNIFSLYEEILKTYEPTTLLIGHDEILGLSMYAAESGKFTADIFAGDVRRIHDWLDARKVRTALWGDMLLDHDTWEKKVGSAHSDSPSFRSGPTHLALQQLPKDILILDWHYGEKKSYESIDHFRKNGYSVAGTSWHDANAARSFAESVRQFGADGIFSSDWGFWPTMSPAATTLYAQLCAWSGQCSIDGSNSDVAALAETLRDPLYTRTFSRQSPVSLQGSANRSMRAVQNDQVQTIFGFGSFLDLRALKTSRQVLGGILFDLADDNGQKNNALVVSNADQNSGDAPRSLGVSTGSVKAATIAFLHTTFVEEPSTGVRKLGRYLVEYEGGGSEAIDILNNWNITDIRSSEGLRKNVWSFLRSPDVLIGSKPVWRGSSASGIPLNLQLFMWRNPYPNKRISNIKVATSNETRGVQIALVGLTFLE